jgi:hypothetical protein
MMEIWPAGPPKLINPSFSQNFNAVLNKRMWGSAADKMFIVKNDITGNILTMCYKLFN